MAKIHFEWDPKKASSNLRKHGVRFEDTCRVFNDPAALTVFDPAHSADEERWYTLGTGTETLLVVHHTYRNHGSHASVIRIFSARKPTPKETAQYRRR